MFSAIIFVDVFRCFSAFEEMRYLVLPFIWYGDRY